MMLVLGLGVLIWSMGHLTNMPKNLRLGLLGLLFVAVVALHLTLPDAHPLRLATGESAAPWLMLGGAAAIVFVYRSGLNRLRRRVETPEMAVPSGPFSEVELDRYARHIILREIGGPGQLRLKKAKVLVVGAGGLGSPVLLYLAAAGVGTIGVIDDDTVDLSNLQRQVIHTDDRTGMPKVFSAQAGMLALNPHVNVRPYNRKLTADAAATLFADYDLIIDGTDSFATRQMVNAAAVAAKRPLIAGAIGTWEGQITLYDPAKDAPCMACIFPSPPAEGQAPTCAEAGVVGALPGIVGSMMALEAVKEITGAGEGLRGRMLMYDALYAQARSIEIKRITDCQVCQSIQA